MAGFRPLILDARYKVMQSGDHLSVASTPMPFIFVGQMSYSQYLYGYSNQSDNVRRSGNSSNGFRWTDCSPVQALFTGKIIGASVAVTGAAVSDNNTSGNKTLRVELFEVGFSTEGTSKGTFDIAINGTIGAYYNDSVLTGIVTSVSNLNISIQAGKLYALKFLSISTTGFIVSCRNLAISLEAVKL